MLQDTANKAILQRHEPGDCGKALVTNIERDKLEVAVSTT